MDFSGKQVAVIGYGKSGKAALELLGKLGAKRILYDQKLDCNAPGIDAEVLVSGDFKEEGWDDVDCAVFSPGVPVFEKIGDFFRSKNILHPWKNCSRPSAPSAILWHGCGASCCTSCWISARLTSRTIRHTAGFWHSTTRDGRF